MDKKTKEEIKRCEDPVYFMEKYMGKTFTPEQKSIARTIYNKMDEAQQQSKEVVLFKKRNRYNWLDKQRLDELKKYWESQGKTVTVISKKH